MIGICSSVPIASSVKCQEVDTPKTEVPKTNPLMLKFEKTIYNAKAKSKEVMEKILDNEVRYYEGLHPAYQLRKITNEPQKDGSVVFIIEFIKVL